MRFFLSLITISALTTSTFAEEMTAKDVIRKAIDAAGGEKTLKSFPAVVTKSKGTIVVMGMELAFTSYEMKLDPDKSKQTINVEAGGQELQIVQIVNGDKLHRTFAGNEMGLPDDAKAEILENQIVDRVQQLYPLLTDKGFEIKLLKEKGKVDDKEAFVLTISHNSLREMKLFIDAKSFLVTKIEKEGLNGSAESGKQEWFLENHKKHDGIMVPMKVKILHEGKAFLDVEVTEIKHLEKLEKSEFDIGK